jgi:cytochrome c oxidase assembly factor CtaG
LLTWLARCRSWLALAAVVLILGMLLPPVGTYARQYALAEALQYVVFAVAVPALLVLGSPWRLVGLFRRPGANPGRSPSPAYDLTRPRRPGAARAVVVLVAFVALVIAWRVPVLLSALARDRGLAVAEMVTLVAAGSALWLELVPSPPLLPGLSRPQRAAMAAASMWAVWVLAYITGMSKVAWPAAYSHATGHGLSSAADQQFAVAVMWAVPALCFVPVIYGMIIAWLRDSADPDEELREAGAGDPAGGGLSGLPRPPRGWRSPST